MKVIENADQLKGWEEYREFMKLQLKLVGGEGGGEGGAGEPIFVSKDKLEFEINGKPWKGHAVLAGPKGLLSARKLKQAGVMFREGTCVLQGKDLELAGLPAKLVKESEKTFMKLRLGFKILGGTDGESDDDADSTADAVESDDDAESSGGEDLLGKARKIAKAVEIWKKTEEVATRELRKLQKALMDLDDPRARPVIRGLESIVTRIDTIDDEAKAVADAAKQGDATAFEQARAGFTRKMGQIRAYVENDELIRQADANPLAEIKLQATFTRSLDQLLASV